ncbi:hypothetical protein AB0M95_17330 [Sphaerisporangium sp. NPDC051017]
MINGESELQASENARDEAVRATVTIRRLDKTETVVDSYGNSN